MRSQRSQVLLLSSSAALVTLLAIVLMPTLHGVLLGVLVACYALAIAGLAGYVVAQMVKMKRRSR